MKTRRAQRTRVAVLALAVGVLPVATACGSDDAPTRVTGTTASSTAPPATAAPGSTAAPSATTGTTTRPTSPATSATTARPSPSTAPATAPVLRLGGLGRYDLGAEQAVVVAGIDDVLGPSAPAVDPCPQYEARAWDGLTVVFYEGRFLAWTLAGPTEPRLVTDRGIGIGDTIADVRVAYPELVIGPSVMDEAHSVVPFSLEDDPAKMWGEFSGNEPGDTLGLIEMWGLEGAPGCGRS